MTSCGRTFLAPAFLIAMTGTAFAQGDAKVDLDMRCMAVMAKINQLPDPRHQLESLIGGYYYLGRLNAASPGLDVGQGAATSLASMSPSQILTETARCEQEMRAQGKTIHDIGNAVAAPPPGVGK